MSRRFRSPSTGHIAVKTLPVRSIHALLVALIFACQAAYGLHAAEVLDADHVHNPAECIVCFTEGHTGAVEVAGSLGLLAAGEPVLAAHQLLAPAGPVSRAHPIRGPPVSR